MRVVKDWEFQRPRKWKGSLLSVAECEVEQRLAKLL